MIVIFLMLQIEEAARDEDAVPPATTPIDRPMVRFLAKTRDRRNAGQWRSGCPILGIR